MRVRAVWRTAGVILLALLCLGSAAGTGFQADRRVRAPTRLDWEFAARPSPVLPASYDSRKQRYQLFVPGNYLASRDWPLVLFLSAGDEPLGWRSWRSVCENTGCFFASPYGVGNLCPASQRIRAALDVLDDIRLHYRIDPQRTYLAGIGGGARVASHLACSYPEYVGGIVCIAGDLRLPRLAHLQHRLRDRISVALLASKSDAEGQRTQRYLPELLRHLGVRHRLWEVPETAHSLPSAETLQQVHRWLDEDVKRRQEDPLTRALNISDTPTRRQLTTRAWSLLDLQTRDADALSRSAALLEWIAARGGEAPLVEKALESLSELREDKLRGPLLQRRQLAERRAVVVATARALENLGDLVGARQAWEEVSTLSTGEEVRKAEAEQDRLRKLRTRRPYLGVSFAGSTTTVRQVLPGSPAQAAGMEPGDDVQSVDKVAVSNLAQIREQLQGRRPGDELAVRIKRQDRSWSVVLRLGATPEEK